MQTLKTLIDLTDGQSAFIHSIGQGIKESYKIRLMELGFQPGDLVSCVMRPKFGAPPLYKMSNSIFSLDTDIAKFIELKE